MLQLLKAFFSCAIFFCTISVYAQEFPPVIQQDSVCYKFSFLKGDSLVYLVTASDSIVLDKQPQLVKRRTESILLVCDSVGANGHFYLTQSLVGFAARESIRDTSTMMRFESAWLKRRASFEIDETGKRYSWRPDDSTREAVDPGGAFQQNLIFPIIESCKRVNESWMVRATDDLPENGVPAPVREHTTMFRALDPVDTLGERCNRFQITLTGQGVSVNGVEGKKIRTTSILTTFGIMEISTEKHIPVHFFVVSETKLKIETQRGQSTQGKQFNRMNYTLVSYRSKNPQKIPLKSKAF
ncbi:MAG: hypothetical protein V4642_05355 [Bacteroidota bacterium]